MNPLALGRVRRLCNELGVLLHQQYPIVEEYCTGRGKKRQAAGYRLHCIGGACGACASWIGPRPALPPLVSVFLLHLHACASTEAQHMHVRCVRPHPPRFRSSDGRMGKKRVSPFLAIVILVLVDHVHACFHLQARHARARPCQCMERHASIDDDPAQCPSRSMDHRRSTTMARDRIGGGPVAMA